MIKVDIINELAQAADITKVKAVVAVEAVLEALKESMRRWVEGILKAEAGWLLLTDPETGELVFQIGLGRTRATAPSPMPSRHWPARSATARS